MIVRDDAAALDRCLRSLRDLIDRYTIIDTGSSYAVRDLIEDALPGFPGQVIEHPWVNFGQNLTQALARAGNEGWLLTHVHADMTAEVHPDLRAWLDSDPDPTVDAWQVPIVEAGTCWHLPMLLRADQTWRFVGATHEYLDTAGRRQRQLLGLRLIHHADGMNRAGKLKRDLSLLVEGVNQGDPRAVYYTAQTLRDLGMTEEAAVMYDLRASMNGWEEERWHARYQAAKLRADVDGLLECWRARPSRHEPLVAAAQIVKAAGTSDILFIES